MLLHFQKVLTVIKQFWRFLQSLVCSSSDFDKQKFILQVFLIRINRFQFLYILLFFSKMSKNPENSDFLMLLVEKNNDTQLLLDKKPFPLAFPRHFRNKIAGIIFSFNGLFSLSCHGIIFLKRVTPIKCTGLLILFLVSSYTYI